MKRSILIVLAFVSFAVAGCRREQSSTWSAIPELPTGRYAHASSVVGGKIYVIGGTPDSDGPSLDVVEVYDPGAARWSEAASMPTARLALAADVVDGIIYAIGGTPGESSTAPVLATVEAYDPATDVWSERADMPTARFGVCTGVVDGIIYVIGGLPTQNSLTAVVEAYDPATDSWSARSDLPTPLGFHACAVHDGKIYAFGGGATYGRPGAFVYSYDPARDVWATHADMPDPNRAFLAAATLDGLIYVAGGQENARSLPLATVLAYDPAADNWTTETDMPAARHFHTASVLDGMIYVIGGRVRHTASEAGVGFTTVDVLNPGD